MVLATHDRLLIVFRWLLRHFAAHTSVLVQLPMLQDETNVLSSDGALFRCITRHASP